MAPTQRTRGAIALGMLAESEIEDLAVAAMALTDNTTATVEAVRTVAIVGASLREAVRYMEVIETKAAIGIVPSKEEAIRLLRLWQTEHALAVSRKGV